MKKKILVVDDEEFLLMMLRTRLEAAGYEVITAKDGNEALEKTKAEKPNLIVMDIRMPNKDGKSFLADFKSDEKMNQSTPIIILTADEKITELYRMERNLECIMKPFRSEKLMEKIKKYIEQ